MDCPKRRKSDGHLPLLLSSGKGFLVLGILMVSLWGNASNFDETELRVIRDVAVAIVLGTGAQKLLERWLESPDSSSK